MNWRGEGDDTLPGWLHLVVHRYRVRRPPNADDISITGLVARKINDGVINNRGIIIIIIINIATGKEGTVSATGHNHTFPLVFYGMR